MYDASAENSLKQTRGKGLLVEDTTVYETKDAAGKDVLVRTADRVKSVQEDSKPKVVPAPVVVESTGRQILCD